MAHAQKPDLVFQRNGRVHLNRQGCQFSRLLPVEECGSAGSDCIDRVPTYSARLLATQSIRIFPLHFPSRASLCAITFRMRYTRFENRIQTALIFNFRGKFLFILPWWLVTDICDTVVIVFSSENRRYAAHCCNQLAGNFYDWSCKAVFPFLNVERFWCLKIPDHSWILPCLKICGLVTDIHYTEVI